MRVRLVLYISFIFLLGMTACKRQQVKLKSTNTDVIIQNEFKGGRSGIIERKDVVIDNQEEWRELWDELNSKREPQPDLPQIYFDSQIVIATFMGEKRTGGYEIRIDKIQQVGNEITVKVEENSPAKGDIVTHAFTQPYHIVIIPKVDDKSIKFIH